jgi:hypothetical protein
MTFRSEQNQYESTSTDMILCLELLGSSESGEGLNSVVSPPINNDESGLVDEAIQQLKGGK